MISIEQLSVEFGVKPLFRNVSFVVNDRDHIALVGKNGAGKSTMLKIICGLQKPTEGNVAIPTDTTIGYLPQVMVLQDNTTVKEEARKAFADTAKLKAQIEELNRQMTERTDYESPEYAELVEKFTQKHDHYMMMGGDNYEAEIERTLTGLGATTSTAQQKSSAVAGVCVSSWPRFCCADPMCCCSTSQPTTSTLRVSVGSSDSCSRAQRLWFW